MNSIAHRAPQRQEASACYSQNSAPEPLIMYDPAEYELRDDEGGGLALYFSGDLTVENAAQLDKKLRSMDTAITRINLADVKEIDTIGAWLVQRTANDSDAEIIGASDTAKRLLARVSEFGPSDVIGKEELHPALRIFNEVGFAVATAIGTMFAFLAFIGQVVMSFVTVLFRPRRIRLNAMVMRFEMVGIRALGIIGLMSFLIGIVIAQQGAVQLRQFGAEVFTINLIGRLTFRELGVLMTAIMIAGRSGSAFAAQIGTMKITEEVDAMRTIGVSPIEALVLPRTLATILWMPLLGFYASFVAIIGGGLLCWIVLEIPPITFIQRLREVTPMTDFWIGMIKAPVFGAIIAMAGCFQGLQVTGNAEEVGKRTTAAVVQAIFLVIVLDAFFAVFFSSIGWD